MSAPQQFATIAAALEAFAAGRCKRWVSVDGHQIDLVQAQAEAGRVREEPPTIGVSADEAVMALVGRPAWDRMAADSVARNLRGVVADVLPELAAPEVPAPPPVECCRACGRPLIGGAS